MPITTTNSFSLTTIQHIIIDCAKVTAQPDASRDLSALVSWIRSVPQKKQIHVLLRSATANATGRRLKGVFQSLGCTVSMQTRF